MFKRSVNFKKVILAILGIMLFSTLFADVSVYGLLRTGAWYYNSDKTFTGSKSITEFTSTLYAASRIGAKFTKDGINGKFEIGVKNNNAVFLRLAFVQFKKDNLSFLVGQDFTGFTSKNYSSQVTSFNSSTDLANVGLGAFFDSRKPMLKICYDKKLYVIFMQPSKVNPANLDPSAINALFPKINLGYNFIGDNFSVFPTFGLNFSKYDKENNSNNLNIDDTVLAYAFATTFNFKLDVFELKGQVNYGQNISDYGIKGYHANALFDFNKNSVINNVTLGGFLQTGFNLSNKKLIFGFGYTSTKNDNQDDPNTAMDTFLQINLPIAKNLTLTPELGYIDYMEDGNGNEEGSQAYFGSRLQAKF